MMKQLKRELHYDVKVVSVTNCPSVFPRLILQSFTVSSDDKQSLDI